MTVKETIFKYDSRNPKFFGTKVLCDRFNPFRWFEAHAYRDIQSGYPVDARGPLIIIGSFAVPTTKELTLQSGPFGKDVTLDPTPFDVEVHTYNPFKDLGEVAKIVGATSTAYKHNVIRDEYHVHYVGHIYVPWCEHRS